MSASVTPPCKGHTDPSNLILTTHPVDTLDTCASSWFLCSKQTDLSTFEDKLPTGVFATPSCKTTNVLCLSPEKTSDSTVFPMKQAVGTLANTGDFARKAVVCVPSPTEYFVGFVIFSISGERVIVSGLECEIVECLKHKVPEASTVDLAVRRIGGSSELGLYVAGHPEYCLRFYHLALKLPSFQLIDFNSFSVCRGTICQKCCGMVYPSPPPPPFRKAMFDRIIDKLKVEKVCMLSAPPASGKTCFLDDFKRYVKPKRYHYLAVKKTAEVWDPATYYNCASKEYNELDLALEGLNQKGLDPLWVFLDEAQETYSFSRMWVGFRNAKLSNANVRVMAVSVYTRSLLFDHNVALPRENRMYLYHSKISSWPHLAFSEGERKAYLKKADIEYPAELETHLIAFGQGHPCIFTKYLTFVVSKIQAAGDGGAAQFNLSSMPAEFQKLVKEGPDVQRSLPPFDIPPAVRAVLTTVLAKGSVTISHLPRLPGACVIVERQDIEWYLEGKLGSVCPKKLGCPDMLRSVHQGLPDPQGLLDPLKSPRHVYREVSDGGTLSDYEQTAHDMRRIGWLHESETTLDSLTRITLVPATDVHYNYIKELLLSPKIPELLQNLT